MNAEIINCFIASPNDTEKERQACDEIFADINNSLGKILNCRIESIKWENNVRPGFGEHPQEVINNQVGNNYDLFIGIMWKKFGSPTSNAGSGTEEEFDRAYKRFKNNDNIEIMMYFNHESADLDKIDPVELTKIKEFKEKVKSLGGLYSLYNGIEDFKVKLRNSLLSFLNKRFPREVTINNSKKTNDVNTILERRLNDALVSYASQPKIWIEPILSSTNDISENPDDNFKNKIKIIDILNDINSNIIKAPPQFGLTCLSHYLISEAWKLNDLWIYIDAKIIKAHNIKNAVKREANNLGFEISDIKCIVIDSWSINANNPLKLLKNVIEAYPSIRIIIMNTIDDAKFLDESENIQIEKQFTELHLLALPRTEIRRIVSSYNSTKEIGDEDVVLSKVINDLECLNLHRTPINILTLLKVCEKYFDESPINRTKMLEMVLFVLFDFGQNLNYKSKPDVKDCEYVLGKFCEILIRNNRYEFSKEEFIDELTKYCHDKLIQLDIEQVFNVLTENHILVQTGINYIFRSSYWILYFAAKEMHSNQSFTDYIFEKKFYISCPEIIEFYTGIDRKRNDALKILTSDLNETRNNVNSKVQLPNDMNAFDQISWQPTEADISKLKDDIVDDVIKSGLPDFVKDQYADTHYNQIRPYNQNIRAILHEYSLLILMQKIKACSRALRNSDYVDSQIKTELLSEITLSWSQLSNVLLVLAPIMATKGHAAFEGADFILTGDFGETYEEKIKKIIIHNPFNVIKYFKDDIYSNKIGPLLYNHLNSNISELRKHQIILLLIMERPPEWKKHVEQYIIRVKKNSFYLYNVIVNLITEYQVGFISSEQSKEIMFLYRKAVAKHELGIENPGIDKIVKIPNKILPKRDVDDN